MEELLRFMTKQKTERTVPSLRSLDAMLSAYVGDLSAVNPAIKTYSEAILEIFKLERTQAASIGAILILVHQRELARLVPSHGNKLLENQ